MKDEEDEEEEEREGEREGGREPGKGGGGREEGGSLASSLICKKCITSEIKRKITAPKQNTQRGRGDEMGEAQQQVREGGWGDRG